MTYDPVPSSSTPYKFSPADHPVLAEFADKPRGPRKGGWLAAVVACFVIGLVCALLAVWFVPKELQRWRLASAAEQRLNGDPQGAMQQLNQDIQRNPRDIELRRTKSLWLLEDKQYEDALNEVNQIISWRPADVKAYILRSKIYHSIGKHEKAVEDYKRVLGFDAIGSGPDRAEVLNGLAYARALANIEIDDGLADISEAMRMIGENFAMLDTRGFLYYRKGDFDRALNDLDHAVTFAEERYAALPSARRSFTHRQLKKLADQEESQMVAVIRYHRALVHEARKESDKAEADYRRVRELGFEPSESLF